MTSARPAATAAALAATLGLAAASWAVAAWQMTGMDMGVATRLGSPGFFAAVWVVMMAAMMLPGAAPAVVRRARAGGGVRAVPLFAGSYLAVWALAGAGVHAVDRPHGTVAAGAVTIAAGVYELTPLERYFRRRCRQSAGSRRRFGLCCAGSGTGLMAMLVALGVMSLPWMTVIAVLVTPPKLLPPKPRSMCRWRWRSPGLASGSSSRPQRFAGSRQRCRCRRHLRRGPGSKLKS